MILLLVLINSFSAFNHENSSKNKGFWRKVNIENYIGKTVIFKGTIVDTFDSGKIVFNEKFS
jgi:hypothetical protein